MSESYNQQSGPDLVAWVRAGLKEFGAFGDRVTYCNQEDDYADSTKGEWFYADDTAMTIYFGRFNNDESPGARMWAEVYDDKNEYESAKASWEAKEEYLPEEEEEELCYYCGELIDDCRCNECDWCGMPFDECECTPDDAE